MDPQTLKILVVGIVAFGAFAGVPVILGLLSHQHKMAELFAKNSLDTSEVLARLEAVERRLANQAGTRSALDQDLPPNEMPEQLRVNK